MESFINTVNGIVWSPALVYLCLGAGLFLSLRGGFLQLRHLKHMWQLLFQPKDNVTGVSSFQALSMTLAGRVGTGNIAGVATAITFGGPGAIFWMWMVAFLGASSAFVESTLGQVYKEKINGEYRAQVVVNAGGIWGHDIARKAGVTVNMLPAKGSLLIFGHRVNNIVLNRCRKPADADILVPGDTISLIGTTSSKVPFDEVDDMYVTADEVDLLLREGMKLAPSLEHTRILRAYAGVRPLVASDDDPSGRSVSRGIVVLDHATRDGLEGFVTITGGKLMTYRLMAEWTTDLICKKLNLTAKCTTAEEKLPGSREPEEEVNRRLISVPVAQRASSIHRHGDMAGKVAAGDAARRSLVCECEEVSVGEVEYALNELDVNNLVDLRRRTRVGMGTCQGELCACRAAGLMAEAGKYCVRRAKEDLTAFLNERWKGMAPVAWGDTLRESEFTMWLYDGVCGLTSANNTK